MKHSKRRLISLIAAVSIITTMSGCSNSNNKDSENKGLLSGTLLESAVVADVDGDLSIIRVLPQSRTLTGDHDHYFNIVTGEFFQKTGAYTCKLRECDNIDIIGSITAYLTEDELLKASNGELTNEDIVSIVYRVSEESKSLTLK